MDSGKRFFLFLIYSSSFLVTVSAIVPKGITLKLIHRDSINYSSNNPSPDLSRQAFGDSMSGFAHIEETVAGCGDAGGGPCPKDIEATLRSKPDISVLFVEFFIKDTSYRILGVMDTGSSLTWVHCIPCKTCGQASSRIYNQRMSSTYRNISCKSPYCDALRNHWCDELGNCIYKINYDSAPPSIGSLSMESFIFETSDNGFVTIPNVVFGCSHLSGENPDSVMGLVGLSAKMTSLATQFGGKFSYCIDNINDRDYKYNQLSFGDAVRFEGDVTPLFVDPFIGHYYADLEGISLGGKMINLPSKTFRKRGPTYGGVLIDSGSEITILPMEVYDIVAEVVRKTASLEYRFKGAYGIRRLCLEGNLTTDMDGFPILTFHFPGGAELAMDVDDLFFQAESAAFCMTLVTARDPPGPDHFTLGIHPQLHNNIGVDPSAKKLYIQRTDCELLSE